jgi:hypothetical protein
MPVAAFQLSISYPEKIFYGIGDTRFQNCPFAVIAENLCLQIHSRIFSLTKTSLGFFS